jgi:hypothetical protein
MSITVWLRTGYVKWLEIPIALGKQNGPNSEYQQLKPAFKPPEASRFFSTACRS